mmetsp:Transcript_84855/g.154684  ORF Transcript_84855/g.154684 Transcript_84855/m.154684 type:complete len:212 (-) Transcript_84855:3-638(-)
MVVTSFGKLSNGGLYHLVKDMQAIAKNLVDLDESLQDKMNEIPRAVKQLHDSFEPVQSDIAGTLKESLAEAKVVRTKIDTFNERIEESVKHAKKFNTLIQKQENYKENKLPVDMNEMAGAVISHLAKAQKLGKMLLAKDAEELLKVAKVQAEKYSAATAGVPGPLVACLIAAARQETLQEKLAARRHERHREASCQPAASVSRVNCRDAAA